MFLNRWTIRTSAALLAGIVAVSDASAQERTLFSWRGKVDREMFIVMRGRDVQVRGTGLDASYRPRLELREGLPRADGNVHVRLVDGRGTLQVIEQPSARNGYATTLRITDSRSGQDNYAFVATWRPDSYGDRDGRGRDNDRWGDRGRGNDGWNDRDGRGRDNCDHPNRNNGRGRDDDRCDRNRRDNDRWDDRRDGYGGGTLHWSGLVDDVSEIRINGRHVEYRTRSGHPLRDVRYDVRGAGLPDRPVNMSLGVTSGRGLVQVVQQPTRANGYTAVIRVTDKKSGYGAYDFNLSW